MTLLPEQVVVAFVQLPTHLWVATMSKGTPGGGGGGGGGGNELDPAGAGG